ncbi:MAG: response regulator transcription factor [Myxococcota bacterium]
MTPEVSFEARVLVIDDDEDLRARLRSFLALHLIDVVEAVDGVAGLAALERQRCDAVLVDVMMPGLDGLEVVRRIRAHHNVPIVMLTGRDSESDKVLGLELGADDYIAKPFSPRELLARVRAVMRRAGPASDVGVLAAHGIEVHPRDRTATLHGDPLLLSGIELDLLVALLRSRGVVLPRETLLERAGRSSATVTLRSVDVHISRLRQKLGDDPRAPRLIKTVHGVGYIFAD